MAGRIPRIVLRPHGKPTLWRAFPSRPTGNEEAHVAPRQPSSPGSLSQSMSGKASACACARSDASRQGSRAARHPRRRACRCRFSCSATPRPPRSASAIPKTALPRNCALIVSRADRTRRPLARRRLQFSDLRAKSAIMSLPNLSADPGRISCCLSAPTTPRLPYRAALQEGVRRAALRAAGQMAGSPRRLVAGGRVHPRAGVAAATRAYPGDPGGRNQPRWASACAWSAARCRRRACRSSTLRPGSRPTASTPRKRATAPGPSIWPISCSAKLKLSSARDLEGPSPRSPPARRPPASRNRGDAGGPEARAV